MFISKNSLFPLLVFEFSTFSANIPSMLYNTGLYMEAIDDDVSDRADAVDNVICERALSVLNSTWCDASGFNYRDAP